MQPKLRGSDSFPGGTHLPLNMPAFRWSHYVRESGVAPRSGFAHATLRLTTYEKSALFSARTCFASLHSNPVKAPFVSANLTRKGTKSAAHFSHIFACAAESAPVRVATGWAT